MLIFAPRKNRMHGGRHLIEGNTLGGANAIRAGERIHLFGINLI